MRIAWLIYFYTKKKEEVLGGDFPQFPAGTIHGAFVNYRHRQPMSYIQYKISGDIQKFN